MQAVPLAAHQGVNIHRLGVLACMPVPTLSHFMPHMIQIVLQQVVLEKQKRHQARHTKITQRLSDRLSNNCGGAALAHNILV